MCGCLTNRGNALVGAQPLGRRGEQDCGRVGKERGGERGGLVARDYPRKTNFARMTRTATADWEEREGKLHYDGRTAGWKWKWIKSCKIQSLFLGPHAAGQCNRPHKHYNGHRSSARGSGGPRRPPTPKLQREPGHQRKALADRY